MTAGIGKATALELAKKGMVVTLGMISLPVPSSGNFVNPRFEATSKLTRYANLRD